MKLYRVKLQGMRASATGVTYGDAYVLADTPNEAYQKVREFVDKNNLGFRKDREMLSVELLAAENQYNDTGKMIFV